MSTSDGKLPLGGVTQPDLPGMPAKRSIEDSFTDFDQRNPHVYDLLVGSARELVAGGRRRFGVALLFEFARHTPGLRTVGDPYRLNNSYRSRYARAIMQREPDLANVFATRAIRSR